MDRRRFLQSVAVLGVSALPSFRALAHAATYAGKLQPAASALGPQLFGTFLPPNQCIPNLVDYWDLRTTASKVFTDTPGSNPLTADFDTIRHWKSMLGNLPVVAGKGLEGPAYRTAVFGKMPGAEFSEGQQGLVGNFVRSFGSGLSIILVGKLTADAYSYRPLLSMAPHLLVQPYNTPDGLLICRNTDDGVTLSRYENDWPSGSPAYVAAAAQQPAGMPCITVYTLDKVADIVDAAWATYRGIAHISVNGGHIQAYDNYQDVTDIDVGLLGIGTRTNDPLRLASKNVLFGVYITDGPVSPQSMQKFYDSYINQLMPGVF
jgi:hypothetical protein